MGGKRLGKYWVFFKDIRNYGVPDCGWKCKFGKDLSEAVKVNPVPWQIYRDSLFLLDEEYCRMKRDNALPYTLSNSVIFIRSK